MDVGSGSIAIFGVDRETSISFRPGVRSLIESPNTCPGNFGRPVLVLEWSGGGHQL